MVPAPLAAALLLSLAGTGCPALTCEPAPGGSELHAIPQEGLELPTPITDPELTGLAEDPLGLVGDLLDQALPGPRSELSATDPGPTPSTDPAPPEPAQGPTASSLEGPETAAAPTTGHIAPHGPETHAQAVPHDRPAPPSETPRGLATGSPGAQAAGLLGALILVGLYHHLTKERLLEHPRRRRILEMLEEDPGLGTPEVADRLGCCYRTARHHLDKLAGFDLVVALERGRRKRWALPEDATDAREQLTEAEASILSVLEDDPGLHLSELARRLDLAKATAKLHLDRLTRSGRVRDERVGPLRRFFPDGNPSNR